MAKNVVEINKLTHETIITVTIKKQFFVRLKIAKTLFRLGARVLGCGIKIEQE